MKEAGISTRRLLSVRSFSLNLTMNSPTFGASLSISIKGRVENTFYGMSLHLMIQEQVHIVSSDELKL